MIEQETPFSRNLRRATDMFIEWWPPLRLVIRSQRPAKTEGKVDYSKLSPQQVCSQLSIELHDYIMQHDVKEQDIEDFLLDKLDQLYSAETEDNSAQFIGQQIMELIRDLQKESTKKMEELEQMYQKVKGKEIQYVTQGDQQEFSEEQDDIEEEEEQEQEQVPKLVQGKPEEEAQKVQKLEAEKQREKELEDDGWVIVRKK